MSKKKKDKKKEPEKPKPSEKPPEVKEENENPFDFGGLPPRDLKKNLGCG
jgi:hypothetical protein